MIKFYIDINFTKSVIMNIFNQNIDDKIVKFITLKIEFF